MEIPSRFSCRFQWNRAHGRGGPRVPCPLILFPSETFLHFAPKITNFPTAKLQVLVTILSHRSLRDFQKNTVLLGGSLRPAGKRTGPSRTGTLLFCAEAERGNHPWRPPDFQISAHKWLTKNSPLKMGKDTEKSTSERCFKKKKIEKPSNRAKGSQLRQKLFLSLSKWLHIPPLPCHRSFPNVVQRCFTLKWAGFNMGYFEHDGIQQWRAVRALTRRGFTKFLII